LLPTSLFNSTNYQVFFRRCQRAIIHCQTFSVAWGERNDHFSVPAPRLWLLFDFFGRTLHASWKQKSCLVMFSLWLNDWVNERHVQTVCLWGEICMKFLHCFGAGMLFICNLHSLTFLRKSSAAIYFPPLLKGKTNTSALEILTEMIKPSPRNFFLNPMQFSMFTLSN